MLKAFSKVFHKSQGPHDEQPAAAAPDAHQSQAKQPVKRTLERRQASASGHDAAGAAGVLNLTSPRRNAAEVGAGGAHVQTPALGPIASPAKRTSVQQRPEHNPLQPRLHLKGPAPGVDGRFALTADNIEWHLRLIPPMKESKYDWIVRYVQEQQQNVAAAAAEPSQNQRDIESSMLMTGQMQYEYVGLNYLDHRAVAAAHQQQQQQQQLHQQQQLQLQMMHAPVHPRAHISNGNGNINNNNHSQHQFPPPIQQSLTNNTNTTGNVVQREADMLPPDNEEDDNTPLAAINTSLSPRPQPTLPKLQPTSLSIGHVSCLDKYMTGSLNDPLPEPVSPTRGARLSLMSFQSNMAVNMDTPDIHAISRSHSISNPQSASILDSNYRATPVARSPTGHDSGPPLFSANPIAARQLSCPVSTGSNRPSLNIVSRSRQNQKLDDEVSDDEGDNEPLLLQRPSTVNVLLSADGKKNARAPSIQSKPAAHVLSDAESEPTPALRVVNQVSSHDSDESADGRDLGDMQVVPRTPLLASGGYDDEEDDKPLMRLTERVDKRPPPFLNVNTSVGRPSIASYNYSHNSPDDDDNRPLSSLMVLAQSAADDLGGSLPLPAPRHVIDPDAVVNISDIINETVTPPRTSLGERPTSPLISTGSTRKHSLLLHAFHPGGQGSETTGGAVAGGTDLIEPSLSEMSSAVNNARSAIPLKRRSNLSSGCSGQPAMRGSIATNRTSSLPQSLKLVTDNPDPILINQQQQQHHQLVSYSFDASEAIGEGSGENDDGELSLGNSADSSSKRRQDASRALAILESGQADSTSKRPWAMNRAHSASALSLASSRRAPRGSMLGQQLTDELHMLRDNLARSRREYEKAERRSWQVGDPSAVQQPWVRHENTMSDTALPQKLSSLRPDSANGQGGDINEVATQDETTKVPSPWSYVDKQRPMSTQQLRASKWFGKGSSSRVFHARQQSKDDVTAAAAVQPASPQSVHSTSLSSRISNQLGKLKRSFKHGAAGS
ncbi:hypothetical protein GGH94_005332 [Coemansia aciculifera]|uniref:Uncharacterized protein n=1 Tax=Coemansia aciculifera TaxID=417176 RepID=A0A9W8IGD5_9FUNG|nr:hypothetical protein GGH94_005332 [Coemansia aciculifera]